MLLKLDNIELVEVKNFINDLTSEEKKFYFDIDSNFICKVSVFITAERLDNKVVGISGITSTYGIAYNLFFVVKTQNQSKSIGTKLAERCKEFALQSKLPLLTVIVNKENISAMKIMKRLKCRYSYTHNNIIYSYLTYNSFGRFLGYILPAIVLVYTSPVGKVFQIFRGWRV